VDGELAGIAQYRLRGNRITIFHTEVDLAYEGHGVGTELARSALDDVAARGLELNPSCPFIAAYVRAHPDPYLSVVAEPLRAKVMSG
jgi:predicted GNAT family acetyltransferase